MRRLFGREAAHDEPRQAHWEVFLVLCKLMRWLDRPWIVVTQAKLLQRVKALSGRGMSRRTLNRHLLWLERRNIIARTQRHRRNPRTGKPEYRASLITLGIGAPLWIKNVRDAAAIPFGRLRVPKMAHSREHLSHQKCPLCGQSGPTARSRPPHAGAGNGPRKPRTARTRSTTTA